MSDTDLHPELMDAGDIDGDSELEFIYFDGEEGAINAIDRTAGDAYRKLTLKDGFEGVTSLRVIERTGGHPGGLVFSRNDNNGTRVDLLLGEDIEDMELSSISSGLPKGSFGYWLPDPVSDNFKVLDGATGKVVNITLTKSGDIISQVIIDHSSLSGSIIEGDLDGDGDKDLLLAPPAGSQGNITYCEMVQGSNGTTYHEQDTGITLGSSGVGAVIDIDGDGKEEVFMNMGNSSNLGTLFMDQIGDITFKWTGMNFTSGTPRSLSRELYGNGGIFKGDEGLLYYSAANGLYHMLPESGMDGEMTWRRSSTFESFTLIGVMQGGLSVMGLDRFQELKEFDVIWDEADDIELSVPGGQTVAMLDIDPYQGSDIDITDMMIMKTDLPQMKTGSGVVMVRQDLQVKARDGFISSGGLRIDYDIELDVTDSPIFRESMELALDNFGGTRIPFSIDATSEGSIRVGPVHVEYDAPPEVLTTLPTKVDILEGENGVSIFNIRDHIRDDNLLPQGLDAELVLDEGLPSDFLFLDRSGNLVAQPFRYPDLNGEFMFAFTISDLRNTVQTPPIILYIEPTQDVPVVIRDPGTLFIDEGTSATLELTGELGLFFEPDGEEMDYIWEIYNPNPLTIRDDIQIFTRDDVLYIAPDIEGTGGEFRLELRAYDHHMDPSDGTLTVIKVEIANIDAPPVRGTNPGTVYLIEDQDTPSRITLEGWMIDPDNYLIDHEFHVYSSDPLLEAYIDNIGNSPYLFLHPRGDLVGERSVMVELFDGKVSLMDRIKVIIEPVNDLPVVHTDGKDLLESRGWIVSGHVSDPDSEEGFIEYRVGQGNWTKGWGFKSWSMVIDFSKLPYGGGFVFIRAFDGLEYSASTYIKLTRPEEVPEIPDKPEPPVDDDDDDDDDPGNEVIDYSPSVPDDDGPPWLIVGGLGGAIIAALVFFGWTEVGIVLMFTIGSSIYSKLSKKDILNHEIRGLIRGYIIANPGDHYSSIKRNLDLNNGTLAYHLRVLEQSGFIKSMYDGIYKRYYPSNVNISKLKKNVSKQEEIFNIILDHPGVTMEEIGRLIGVSRQVVNYHVKNLIRAGVVTYNRDRKSAKFYPTDDGIGSFEQT
ncbi:MAG: winged helix-turn-helix transcriptional regulator [Thermoplasmatota archaeon]